MQSRRHRSDNPQGSRKRSLRSQRQERQGNRCCRYTAITPCQGYFIVDSCGQQGVYNKKGLRLVPCLYDEVTKLSINWKAKKDNMCGMLSKSGAIIVPFEYTDIEKLGNKYVVWQGDKVGMLNMNGTKVLECFYDEIKQLAPNYIVKLTGKYGLINSAGEWILQPIYDNFHSFGTLDYSSGIE